MSKPLRSRLQAGRALALSRLGPMDAATSAAEAALDAGRSLGDAPTTALALQALGEMRASFELLVDSLGTGPSWRRHAVAELGLKVELSAAMAYGVARAVCAGAR